MVGYKLKRRKLVRVGGSFFLIWHFAPILKEIRDEIKRLLSKSRNILARPKKIGLGRLT
jgi:hypothetical protein